MKISKVKKKKLQSEKDLQRSIKKLPLEERHIGICSYKAKEGQEFRNFCERHMKEVERVFLSTGWGDITREFVESFVEYYSGMQIACHSYV